MIPYRPYAVLILGTLGTLGLLGTPAAAADLTVVLEKVAPNGGNVRAALYNQADTFLKKPWRGQEAPAPADSVTLVFKDLPAGEYAVSAFQDSNGNQKLDTASSGLPLEPYGMSNGARGGPEGPPSFAAAAFHLGEAAQTITVRLK